MCDEYFDERTKAFWRAMVGEEDLRRDEDKEVKIPDLPLKLEPEKPKPKMLVR